MNKVTLKSRATLVGKVFASKGLVLSRSEQLDLVAQLEGAANWHHLCSGTAPAEIEATKPFDEVQLSVAEHYCEGDFSHLTDMAGLATTDDLLFHFAINEAGDAGGNPGDAARLFRQAADELYALAESMEASEDTAQAADSLALIPKTCTPAMHFEATSSKGDKQNWAIRLVSDRGGDINPRVSEYPHLADWVRDYPNDFESIFTRCLDEMAFIAEVNGNLGVLYEVEIVTEESEGHKPDGSPSCDVSQAKRLKQLARDVVALELLHPNLHWAYGDTIGGPDGRLGVWAFCPGNRLFTVEEAKALTVSLYNTFYS